MHNIKWKDVQCFVLYWCPLPLPEHKKDYDTILLLSRSRSWGRWGWWPWRYLRSWVELGWIIWLTVLRWRRSAEAAPALEWWSPLTMWEQTHEWMRPMSYCIGVLMCLSGLCDSAVSLSTLDLFWNLAQKSKNVSGSHRSPAGRRWAALPSVNQVNMMPLTQTRHWNNMKSCKRC